MSMSFRITNNHIRDAINIKNQAIERALDAIGLQAEGYAKEEISKPKLHADGTIRPNVDTGNLRNSINYIVNNDTAYIGTNVEYAPYVEFGTYKSRPYPYLKPAVQEHIPEYRRIVEEYLRG